MAPGAAIVGLGKLGATALQHASARFTVLGTYDDHSSPVAPAVSRNPGRSLAALADLNPRAWFVAVPAERRAPVIEEIISRSDGHPMVMVFASQRSPGEPTIARQLELDAARIACLYAHPLRLRMPERASGWLQQIGRLWTVHVNCQRGLSDETKGRSPVTLLSESLDFVYAAAAVVHDAEPVLGSADVVIGNTGRGSLLEGLLHMRSGATENDAIRFPINISTGYGSDEGSFEIMLRGAEGTVTVQYIGDHLAVTLARDGREPMTCRALPRRVAWMWIIDDAADVLAALQAGRVPDAHLSRLQTSHREALIAQTLHAVEAVAQGAQLNGLM